MGKPFKNFCFYCSMAGCTGNHSCVYSMEIMCLSKMSAFTRTGIFMLFTLLCCVIPLCFADNSQIGTPCPDFCTCQETKVQCSKLYQIPTLSKNTTELSLRGNYLGMQVSGSLSDLQELQVLDLSRNNIGQVGSSLFSGLTHLKSLNLSDNSLENLPDDLFTSGSVLEILDLSHNQFYVFPEKSFQFLIHLKKLLLNHNQLISPFLGIRFQVMARLSILDLSHNNFQSIPENSFDVVKRWDASVPKQIDLSYNNIEIVEKDSLSALRGLMKFRLAGNSKINSENLTLAISELQNSGIKKLDISYMNIMDIEAVVLNFTDTSLESLNISHNAIQILQHNSFEFLTSLKKLDLSWNKIQTLNGGLRNLERLNYLDLSHNQLTAVEPDDIVRLYDLRNLIISNNNIVTFNKSVLMKFKRLYRLDLSNNNIAVFDMTELVSKSIRGLNLSGNRLHETGPSINIPKLRYLDMSRNKLKKLNAFLLRNSPDIQTVDFSVNQITQVNHQVFKPHVPKVIDLSSNYLYTIKNFNWLQATHIYLRGNLIRTIDYQAFYAMNNVKVLDLSENLIKTIEKDTFNYLTNVTTLNLQGNQLMLNPNEASLFRHMSSLKYLDLSRNGISKLQESTFDRCKEMEFLSLSANQLSTLSPVVFFELQSIRELRLDGNPFRCSCNLLHLKIWIQELRRRQVTWFNQTLVCQSPAERKGTLISDYVLTEFECNHQLIYIVVTSSLVGLGLLVCLLATLVCHYFNRWRHTRSLPDSDEYQFDETMMSDDKYTKNDRSIANGILKADQCNGYIGYSPKTKRKDNTPVAKIKSKLKHKRQPKRSNSVTFGIPISRTADYILNMEGRQWSGVHDARDNRLRRSRSLDIRDLGEPYYPLPIDSRRRQRRGRFPVTHAPISRRHSTIDGYPPSPRQLQRRRQSMNNYLPRSYLHDDHRNVTDIYATARRRHPINPSLGDYMDLPLVTYRRRPSNGNTPIYPGGSATLPRNMGRQRSMQLLQPSGQHGPFTYSNGVIPARVRRSQSQSRIEWV